MTGRRTAAARRLAAAGARAARRRARSRCCRSPTAVSERYFERYPEDLERYGDLARQWEVHDTQHLLNWAIGDVEGHVDLEQQVGWLAGVLEARDFPLEHLAGNLELAAETVEDELDDAGALAGGCATRPRTCAAARASFSSRGRTRRACWRA